MRQKGAAGPCPGLEGADVAAIGMPIDAGGQHPFSARNNRRGHPAQRGPGGPVGRDFSAPVAPGRLAAALVISGVDGGAGTVEGGGDEVAVDLVGDLDAPVAEPAGNFGIRDALGQTAVEA